MTDPEGLTITRTFAAPRELVFEAWTKPEHFAAWWGGKTVEVPADTVAMDVRPGGSWKATMVLPDGGHRIDWVGEYVEVDPPSRLVLTLSDGAPERETLTVDLTEVDGGTQMVFHQGGGHLTAEQYEQTATGYQQFFDAMAELF
ncbi:MAG TPA: SRPBCC domain-containing protein [Galbitalea sp.]|jgi:uncharacterized protein YndB with AHSA1/START domain